MVLPSNELLSAVFEKETFGLNIVGNTIEYSFDSSLSATNYYINVYELMHMMEEWAVKQEYCYAIVSGKLPHNYFCCIQYRFSWLGTDDFEKYFRAGKKQEAVTKACEWVLEQIK